MKQKNLLIILSIIVGIFFIWSLIKPKDYFIWILETFPILIGIPILIFTYKRFKLTNIIYILIAAHAIILLIGAHYTYAENPLFEIIKLKFDLARNHYDRLGHFFQGFVPILIAREFLLRKTNLQKGKILVFLLISIVFLISGTYELIEWGSAELVSQEQAADFVGMQGDIWDAQKDMFMAFLGGISSLILFSRLQNKQLKNLEKA